MSRDMRAVQQRKEKTRCWSSVSKWRSGEEAVCVLSLSLPRVSCNFSSSRFTGDAATDEDWLVSSSAFRLKQTFLSNSAKMGKALAVVLFMILDWQCCSCQHLASAYRLGQPTDNITVLTDRKDDSFSYQEPQWQADQLFQESDSSRSRRDANTLGNNNDRPLVQTMNGLVRGTRKTALGESVDVYLGVSPIFQFQDYIESLTLYCVRFFC